MSRIILAAVLLLLSTALHAATPCAFSNWDTYQGTQIIRQKVKGYFISQTFLKDESKSDLDPEKYVDSTSVPYLVFPGKFYKKSGTGSLGAYGFAINMDSGESSAFVVAEVGPPNAHLGEMSILLGVALGGANPNPRTGAGTPKGKIAYIVFPYTKATPKWPVQQGDTRTSHAFRGRYV
jgi:hypothetical protein